jgi:hypothetical protein
MLPSWRDTAAKKSILDFIAAVTDPDSDAFDADREFAYDTDPVLGSGNGGVLAAAANGGWTVVDIAADWATIYAST